MKSKTYYDALYIKCWKKLHYPVTIIGDRYNGVYSNGRFLAFPIIYRRMPAGPDGSDADCMDFWKDNKLIPVGKGNTPEEAYDDLIKKVDDGDWSDGFTIIDDI